MRTRELEIERRRNLDHTYEELRQIERKLKDHETAEHRRDQAAQALDDVLKEYDAGRAGALRRRIDELLRTQDPAFVVEKVTQSIPGAARPLSEFVRHNKDVLDGAAAAALHTRSEDLKVEFHRLGQGTKSLKNLNQAIAAEWKVLPAELRGGLPSAQTQLIEALVSERARSSSLER